MKRFLRSFKPLLPQYMLLQVLSALLFTALLAPLFYGMAGSILFRSGHTVLSNQGVFGFLLSWRGVVVIFLLFVLILLGLILEVLTMIRAYDNAEGASIPRLILQALRYFPRLCFSRKSPVVFLYLILVVPLSGVGLTLGFLKQHHIPNFIGEVIWSNKLYTGLFVGAILILVLLGLRYIFTFHYLVIENMNLSDALRASKCVTRQNGIRVFIKLIGFYLVVTAISVVISVAWVFVIGLIASILPDLFLTKLLILPLFILQNGAIVIMGFIRPALYIHFLSHLFGELTGRSEISTYRTYKVSQRSLVLILIALVIAGGSIFFQEFFKQKEEVIAIAHRAGGDLAAENSLAGLRLAKERGVRFSEIDVIVSADDKLVINHDNTVKRLSGVNANVRDLTWPDLQQLKIKDEFDPSREEQPYATLEEMLDLVDDNFGLLIELKDNSNSPEVADRIVNLVKQRSLSDKVFVISLDETVINYIEDKYPEILTGYLYYVAIGNITDLKADALIMEETMATEDMIDSIRAAGKLSFVWTVNIADNMDKFMRRGIDGIITDQPVVLLDRKEIYLEDSLQSLLVGLKLRVDSNK